MSEDGKGCGQVVAGGVIACALIFNWCGVRDIAFGVVQYAGTAVSGIARALSENPPPPTQQAQRQTAAKDQRLYGSWKIETSRTNWASLQFSPSGYWRYTLLADKGLFMESYVQEGSSWSVEGDRIVLINESGYMDVGRHDAVNGQETKKRQQVGVRQPIRYGFDSYGRLQLEQSDGTTLALTLSR